MEHMKKCRYCGEVTLDLMHDSDYCEWCSSGRAMVLRKLLPYIARAITKEPSKYSAVGAENINFVVLLKEIEKFYKHNCRNYMEADSLWDKVIQEVFKD